MVMVIRNHGLHLEILLLIRLLRSAKMRCIGSRLFRRIMINLGRRNRLINARARSISSRITFLDEGSSTLRRQMDPKREMRVMSPNLSSTRIKKSMNGVDRYKIFETRCHHERTRIKAKERKSHQIRVNTFSLWVSKSRSSPLSIRLDSRYRYFAKQETPEKDIPQTHHHTLRDQRKSRCDSPLVSYRSGPR